MKAILKSVLSIILVLLLRFDTYGQFCIGPKIGIGVSTFKDTKVSLAEGQYLYDGYIYKSIITPQVGIIMDIELSKIFSIRPEILFNQRGFKATSTVYGYEKKVLYRISYLEAPINIVIGGRMGPGRLELFTGPAFAYGFGGKGKTEINGVATDIDIISNVQPQNKPTTTIYYNPFNASVNLGFGYEWKGLLVQISYNAGLTNVQPYCDDSVLADRRNNWVTKSSSFHFAIGYLIGKANNR